MQVVPAPWTGVELSSQNEFPNGSWGLPCSPGREKAHNEGPYL